MEWEDIKFLNTLKNLACFCEVKKSPTYIMSDLFCHVTPPSQRVQQDTTRFTLLHSGSSLHFSSGSGVPLQFAECNANDLGRTDYLKTMHAMQQRLLLMFVVVVSVFVHMTV